MLRHLPTIPVPFDEEIVARRKGQDGMFKYVHVDSRYKRRIGRFQSIIKLEKPVRGGRRRLCSTGTTHGCEKISYSSTVHGRLYTRGHMRRHTKTSDPNPHQVISNTCKLTPALSFHFRHSPTFTISPKNIPAVLVRI